MTSKNVDIYARVSRKTDARQLSTSGQVEVCRKRLESLGLGVGRVFVDPGISAWRRDTARPEWQAMMARLEDGSSDGVIVFDMERFTRQYREGVRLLEAAERGLLVLDSESEYDLTSPNGKKQFMDAVGAAQYYSDNLQRKVKRGKELKARSGEVDARRSFGFEPDGVTVREAEAEVIRDHAVRLLAGETQEALIAELNSPELGTPSVRGAKWGYTTYRQIMTRPRNAGYIVHKGEVMPGVKLPGVPILDDLTHARIVALYKERKRGRQPSGRYVLTGYADCRCGTRLKGRPVTGTPRRQYWCPGCCHTFVDAARLDDWAGDWAIGVLSDPEHADAVAAAEAEIAAARARLGKEVAGIEATLRNLADKLGEDLSTAGSDRRRELYQAEYDATRRRLLAGLDRIDAELAALVADEPAPPPKGTRRIPARAAAHIGLLDEWTSGTPADRRAMVDRALRGKRIVVGPGRAARFDPDRVRVA